MLAVVLIIYMQLSSLAYYSPTLGAQTLPKWSQDNSGVC